MIKARKVERKEIYEGSGTEDVTEYKQSIDAFIKEWDSLAKKKAKEKKTAKQLEKEERQAARDRERLICTQKRARELDEESEKDNSSSDQLDKDSSSDESDITSGGSVTEHITATESSTSIASMPKKKKKHITKTPLRVVATLEESISKIADSFAKEENEERLDRLEEAQKHTEETMKKGFENIIAAIQSLKDR